MDRLVSKTSIQGTNDRWQLVIEKMEDQKSDFFTLF